MANSKITFHFDTMSPFSAIAYHIIRNDPTFADVELAFKPVSLRKLFEISGNPPPTTIKNKREWISAERLRWYKAFDVPMTEALPPSFPPQTTPIMQALCVLEHTDGNDQSRLVQALDRLHADYWVHHKQTNQPEVLQQILEDMFGKEETAKLLEHAPTLGNDLLVANTEEAHVSGAFGLPWMLCTNAAGEQQGFWGVDHLSMVANFLELPIQRERSGWNKLM